MINYREWSHIPENRHRHYDTVFKYSGIENYKYVQSDEPGYEIAMVDATDDQMELAFQTSIVLTAKVKEALAKNGWEIDRTPPLSIFYGMTKEELLKACSVQYENESIDL